MPLNSSEPRSGDMLWGAARCRRSAARKKAIDIPKAHALGYRDTAAPRLPPMMFFTPT